MSSPIAIPSKRTTAHEEDIASSSSSTSSILYVPLHKRDSSPMRSSADEHGQGFYTRDFLLSLQRSPLSRLDAEKKDHIRSTFPEIAMNRKMRKSLEYHAAMHEKAMKAAQGSPSSHPHSHYEAFHSHSHPHNDNHNRDSHSHSHSPRPHSPQHQPKHDSHTHPNTHAPAHAHARPEETSPTYNPFSPLAPRTRSKQPKPDLRRGRSATRAPERRRYAFGLKMRHGDLDAAVTWRGAGAGRIITAPSVVAV